MEQQGAQASRNNDGGKSAGCFRSCSCVLLSVLVVLVVGIASVITLSVLSRFSQLERELQALRAEQGAQNITTSASEALKKRREYGKPTTGSLGLHLDTRAREVETRVGQYLLPTHSRTISRSPTPTKSNETPTALPPSTTLPFIQRKPSWQHDIGSNQWDDHWNSHGNCSGALRNLTKPALRVRLSTIAFTSALQVLGAGHGTTGTRAIFTLLCQLGLKGFHYDVMCAQKNQEVRIQRQAVQSIKLPHTLTAAFAHWRGWLRNNQHRGDPKFALHPRVVQDILQHVSGLIDSPVVFVPELMNHLNPDTVVLLSLRDPAAWFKSRSRQFGNENVCRQHLWDSVAHPFSIGECLTKHGTNSLTQLRMLRLEEGCEAFIRYNSWVAAVVPRHQLIRYCIWDCNEDGSCGPHDKSRRLYSLLLQLGKRLNTSFASHGRKGLLHPPHDWSLVEQLLRKMHYRHGLHG